MDLGQVGQLRERGCVAEGHEEDAVVHEGGDGVERGGLLAAAGACGGDEDAGVLACEPAGGPEAARGVPEGLCGELALGC